MTNSAYYDVLYSGNKQYFGDHPDNLLKDYYSLCDKRGRVLDIGIGQGRNARFLLKQGYGVDGIDSSSIAIESLTQLRDEEKLDLRLFNISFEEHVTAPRTYSAIMIFGLFPVLSEEQIVDLARKSRRWLKKKGIVFVSGFTTNEIAFRPTTPEWKKLSENSYANDKGSFRTFMDIDEAMSKFRRFKPIYHWEGYGERHSHGDDKVEQHHMFEFILQKA